MKKAELQMQETILVIFIVTIIIGMGLYTFYQFQIKSIEDYRSELEQNRNLILLSTLQNSPELSYSYLGDEKNALDTIKLLDNNLNELGLKEITVKLIYPEDEDKLCGKNNYPKCNKYVVYENKPIKVNSVEIISIPISLYYPYSDEYKAGVLELKSYS